jgi:uncharacterized FlaG/YvyC family protein
MKAASIKEIKTELHSLHPARVLELCMHLAKYKKENKELLTYLLFEAHNEQSYINSVKEQMDDDFKGINKSNLYLAKKTLRKALRITNKYIKYSGSKQTEVELLIYYCKKVRKTGIPLHANTVLGNIFLRQTQKIEKALKSLHEDLQFDYSEEMKLFL